MTRLHPAAKAARALVGFGAMFILVVVASGCMSSSQAPSPTPDPFAGLADRSDQAFRQGLEAYGQGQYRDALTAFEQARTLSPTADPRIDQMIERTKAAMAPTPTPVPPTPTAVPASPTATPVAMSSVAPDTELGQRYFGKVTLAIVPGKDVDAPAATQFFFQDQVGLHIEGLKQHLRLPFTLRVFNTETQQLVAQVNSQDTTAAAASDPQRAALAATAAATVGAAAKIGIDPVQAALQLHAMATTQLQNGASTPTAVTTDFNIARFWDTYVWYHQGGETPGRYRLELFANGVLTNSFDYTVGTVPVPTPEVATPQPTVEPTSEPTVVDVVAPPPPPVVTAPAPSRPAYTAPSEAIPTPQPTAFPSPTPVPTPATASGTMIGGLPAGLDVNASNGRIFIADG